MKLRNNNQGVTLIESIVTVMVLAVALTILGSGIFAANHLMNEGRRVQQSLDNQEAVLNGSTMDTVKLKKSKQTLSFQIDDTDYQYNGTRFSTSDTLTTDVTLQTFQLIEMDEPSAEWTMYKNMANMPKLYSTLTDTEKKEIAENFKTKYNTSASHFYMNNDLFIYYVYLYIYNENLPQLDEANIPKEYSGDTPLYMHPFMSAPINTGENVFIYATSSPENGVGKYYISFIYDYGDGEDSTEATGWYYRKGGISISTLLKKDGPSSWKEFRKQVLLPQKDGWARVSK